jgi:FdhE protein
MTSPLQTLPIQPAGEVPAILTPAADVFLTRAARFAHLADGHSLGDWLRFLGTLSRAQHDALTALPADLPLPDAAALAGARQHRMPPLPAQSWPRGIAWHDALRQIASAVRSAAPAGTQADLERLAILPGSRLEAMAERVLHTELFGDDAALLPYVAAALQVLWTGLAMRIGADIQPLDVPGVCPCCGFLPVGSVVRAAGEVGNLRYLHCALCNTEWNLVRVKCSACDSTAGIAYRELTGDAVISPGAVRAETCDHCHSYLKIHYQEKDKVDPVADDLATLALDILVDAAGYGRAGPNLLFVPGV